MSNFPPVCQINFATFYRDTINVNEALDVWYRLYLCSEGIEGNALFNELHSEKHVFHCEGHFIISQIRQTAVDYGKV